MSISIDIRGAQRLPRLRRGLTFDSAAEALVYAERAEALIEALSDSVKEIRAAVRESLGVTETLDFPITNDTDPLNDTGEGFA